jgi:hypothetical protein
MQITERAGFSWTGLHTGWLDTCIYSVEAEKTLPGTPLQGINIANFIGTTGHAIATPDTLMRIYHNYSIFSLVGGFGRADSYADSALTVIT